MYFTWTNALSPCVKAEVLILSGTLLIAIRSDLLGDTLEHQFGHWQRTGNAFEVSASTHTVDLLRNWHEVDFFLVCCLMVQYRFCGFFGILY